MRNSQMMRAGRYWGLALGLVGVLAGCTGGDGDGSSSSGSGGGGGGSPALYDFWLNGSQLRTSPRDEFVAAAANIGSYTKNSHFWLYTQNTATGAGMALDSRNSVLLYIAKNHFYRLPTLASARPEPVQVSGEGAADGMCDWHDPQRQTPNNERATFKYRLSGKDHVCFSADDEFREIHLGMTLTDAPLSINQDRFRADEFYSGSGQLSGYLVAATAGGIYWYDANFANPRLIAAASGITDSYADFVPLASSPDGRYRLLELFSSGVYVFDSSSQSLTKVLDRGTTDTLGYYAGYFYLAQSINGGSKSILRVPVDGSTTAQNLLSSVDRVAGITGNYLVYQKINGAGLDIYSLDLSVGDAIARLVERLATQEQVSVAGGRIYYTIHTASGTTVTGAQAVSLRPDGSDELAFIDSMWAGIDYRNGSQPNFPLLASDHLYLAQNVSFSGSAGWSGGTLSWVDAATGRIGGAIGLLPANVYAYRFASSDSSNTVLGLGYSADAKTTYYLRADRAQGKVATVDQATTDLNHGWKGDWSVAP